MKATRIIYWTSTILLALFILPGIFFMNDKMALEGARHMQIPEWLRWEVGIGSFIGGLILVIPLPGRLKEWAYVGLGIVYISAFTGHLWLDGVDGNTIMAAVLFLVLLTSYTCYHRLKAAKATRL